MTRRAALLCATLLLALGLSAPVATTQAAQAAEQSKPGQKAEPGQQSKQSRTATTYAAKAHAATNAARAAQGMGALAQDRCLQRSARAQARRMAAARVMSHQDLGAVLQRCGLSSAGENVAVGYRSGTSVVVDGWMRSEGHRANILTSSYRAEGVAAVRGADGRWWVAQVFGRTR